MKKIITDIKSLAALLMAGAALAACSGDDNIVEELPATPTQHTYTMTIEATKGGDAATTRALALAGKTLNATWETSNEVKAYNYTQSSAFTGSLKPQSDGALATLTGSLTGSVAVDDIIYLRWPSVDADYTGQDGTLETIAQHYDYTTGFAQVTSVDGTTIGAEDSSPSGGPVLFTNSQAIVKFTLIDKATDSPINATQLTIDAKVKGESRLIQSITYPNTYTLGPITIDRTSSADNVVYAALPFSSQAHFTFNLAATDGTNTYTYEKAGVTMLNGRYYEITVKMNASQATPLTFEAKEADASVTFNIHTSTATNPVEYSTDGSNWTHYTSGTAIPLANVGDKVMFRGDNATYAASSDAVSTFTCDNDCYVYGNVMSLVSPTGYETATALTAGNTFCNLFKANNHIWSHPTNPIVLPATTLSNNCYFGMFDGCTNLTKAPTLPATKMEVGCYLQMFKGTGITVAPALPATTLAQSCYKMMFYECPNLTMPPGLPATKLETLCYAAMFGLCPNLETAPALPATTLVNSCYYGMFSGCTKLNNVTCLATNISANNCTYGWLTGVAATGTFTKAGTTSWTTGGDGIPEGWTVKMTDISKVMPLTFEAKEAGASVTFKTYTGSTLSAPEYSTDGSSWTRYTWGTAITLENVGDKVMFRGDNATYAGGGSYDYSTFTCDKDCYVYGNVMSLVSSTGYVSATTLTAGSTFRKLFEKNTHIVNHPTLSIVLPATTLTNSCYYAMFDGCSQLTKAPALPATKMEQGCYWGMFSETGITAAPALPAQTLANACYMLMFDNCPHLTTPPALPATTLAESCYAGMFLQCSSLEYAPELPATTMMKNCYYAMFTMCGKITTAPVLPAATLAEGCYMSMFSQCTNLNSVTCLATNISAKKCTYDWLTGVAATGTFTKAGEMTGWTTGGNGIPVGWTVE